MYLRHYSSTVRDCVVLSRQQLIHNFVSVFLGYSSEATGLFFRFFGGGE